jgi:voltage-gated potassium channel
MPIPPPGSARRSQRDSLGRPNEGWRLRLYTIIFEADTRAGRAFDLTLCD